MAEGVTDRARPGAYLRVLAPGWVREGDPIRVVDRPIHEVDVGLAFRALTRTPELLPRLLDAGDDLEAELRALARTGRGYELDPEPNIEEP